jgi:hypothetical protein
MRKVLIFFCLALSLSACDLWNIQPQPFPIWTPIPTRTPGVLSATPIILTLTATQNHTPNLTTLTPLPPTETPTATSASETASAPNTPNATPIPTIQVVILGCNTSFDITHAMGEVTNAYITIQNTGSVDLPDTCALLRAIDEDREHPDKIRCVDNLPARYQVTQKLTVDTAFKQDTVIQVDVSSNDELLLRLDKQSCKDISLFGGEPEDTGVIKPIEP